MPCCYGANPLKPPDVPNALDEEFTGAFDGSWVALGGLTLPSDVNSTVPSAVILDGSVTNGMYRPIPAMPFTVDAFYSAYGNSMGAGIRTGVGMFLGESTPGKLFNGSLDIAEDNYFCIVGSAWSNPTTFVTNVGDFVTGGSPPQSGSGTGSGTRVPGYGLLRPFFHRFVVHSSANVDAYISWDGLLFTKWMTGYNPGFTIGSIGLGIWGGATKAAVDFIRFS